jgi:hypothetical protein
MQGTPEILLPTCLPSPRGIIVEDRESQGSDIVGSNFSVAVIIRSRAASSGHENDARISAREDRTMNMTIDWFPPATTDPGLVTGSCDDAVSSNVLKNMPIVLPEQSLQNVHSS